MMASTPFSPGGADMTVSVTDTDTIQEKKDKKHMIYKVIVEANDSSWFIYRRYTEFHSLYDKMKKLFPEADLKLPGKKLFSSLDPHFMRRRREGLNDFVQKLVSHQGLSAHGEVQMFLKIVPSHRQSKSSGTDDDDTVDSSDQNGKDDGSSSSDEEKINLGPSERPASRPADFEFLKVIGKGSFGKVFVAKHKAEDKIYAVKVLNKSHIVRKNEAKHIMSERNVLVKNVQHPFLVGLYYSFQTPDKLYFVLDYVNGGELFFHLQRERCFAEGRSKFYAAEMASAIGYLHSLNIIYRDLKPENILLDSQGHIVLTDFGLCKEGIEGRGTTSTFCGTPEYLAPEVLRKEPYDKTVDWWCLGSVLYEMMFGLPPFYSKNVNEMYDNILHKTLRFRSNVASSTAKHILEGLLQKGKSGRLGAKHDLLELQKHPFFSAINWRLLDERKINPPYNPNVVDHMDLKHFDPEFTREPVPASVGRSLCDQGISASVQDANYAFMGFSYVDTALVLS